MTDAHGATATATATATISPTRLFLGDVTGDGRDDAIAYFEGSGDWYVAPSTGTSFASLAPNWVPWITMFGLGPSRQFVADVNGDGRDDAVVMYPSTGDWYVAPSTGGTFVRDPSTWQWLAAFGKTGGPLTALLGDVNADGRADAVVTYPENGNWYVAPSTGTGFIRDEGSWPWTTLFGASPEPHEALLGDVNGDGRADAVVFYPTDGNWYVAPATGTSFQRDTSTWLWLSAFGTDHRPNRRAACRRQRRRPPRRRRRLPGRRDLVRRPIGHDLVRPRPVDLAVGVSVRPRPPDASHCCPATSPGMVAPTPSSPIPTPATGTQHPRPAHRSPVTRARGSGSPSSAKARSPRPAYLGMRWPPRTPSVAFD